MCMVNWRRCLGHNLAEQSSTVLGVSTDADNVACEPILISTLGKCMIDYLIKCRSH